MNEEMKQKMSSLRAKYVNSPDSQQYIDNLANEIEKLATEKDYAKNPLFEAIIKDAEKRLNEINALLMNDEELSDVQRKCLFAQKKVWIFIFERFSLVPHDNALKVLHTLVDQKLAQ